MASSLDMTAKRGSNELALLMIYWALVAPASMLHYLGLQGLHSTALAIVLAFSIGLATCRRIRPASLLIFAIVVVLSMVNALNWCDFRYLFYGVFFGCALFLVELSGTQGVDKFCSMATRLMLVLLVGAVLAFVLARVGLPPAFTITNPDGQDYYFFYTSFTNTYDDKIIRAAGIYDEPGAFSMYICFTAALRHLLKLDRKTTWLMLGLRNLCTNQYNLCYARCSEAVTIVPHETSRPWPEPDSQAHAQAALSR